MNTYGKVGLLTVLFTIVGIGVYTVSPQLPFTETAIWQRVFDPDNNRIMTTPWAGAQNTGLTSTEILNRSFDAANNRLNTSGGGEGGGSSAWADITAGTNQNQALVIGNGSTLTTTGTGSIVASTALEMATTPDGCLLGTYAHNYVSAELHFDCKQVAFSELSGAATDVQVPDLKDLGTGLTTGRCVRTNNSTGKLEVAAGDCGTGAGEGGTWGSITGTLADQTDLQAALDGKQESLGFTAVPTTRTVCGDPLSSDVTCTKSDVGLGNVDNTSDATKNAAERDITNARTIPRTLNQTDTSPITIDPFYQQVLIQELSQDTTFEVPTGTAPFDGQILEIDLFSTLSRALTFSNAANGFCEIYGYALPTSTDAALRVIHAFKWASVQTCWGYMGTTQQGAAGSDAPADAHYLTTQSETGLSQESNLGSLTTGLLKIAVSGGVAVPSTAIAGTDYQAPLSNVTNDAQLKRAAGDIASFTEKATPVSGDLLIIEDSEAAGVKKKIQIGNLPSSGSGDITDVWGCTTGNCNTLTGAAGDSLNAASADSIIPVTMSTSLPGTCTEGQHHQDTDSGGVETYVCTATNTWVKFAAFTDITAANAGVGNVTNDAQLKRAAADFTSFTAKATPIGADTLLIEDSAASDAKKKVAISALPGMVGSLQLSITGVKLAPSNTATPDVSENNDRLLFDAATSECAIWQFVVPPDYGGSPILKVLYSMTSATTGGVSIDASLMAVTPGDSADINTDSYATVNNCDDAAVPGTAGHLDAISCTMTNNDSVAAEDLVKVKLCRATSDGADTATGDMEVVGVILKYNKYQ